MSLEPFEPMWKKETVKIRRTLHIITQIRDEFLDASGNVVKELRFEKRSLQQPYTLTPLWAERKKMTASTSANHAFSNTEVSSWLSPPVPAASTSSRTSPPHEVPRGVPPSYTESASVSEMPIPSEEQIVAASEGSSECTDMSDIDSPDQNSFAFWDCPKLRTSYRMKTDQKFYIPVYVFSESNKPNKVNVFVDLEGTKRKAARRDDLIYLSELQQYQTVQYWKEIRIGSRFPLVQNLSEKGSKTVAFISSDVSQSNDKFDLILNIRDPEKKEKKISFWNCALPARAVVQPHEKSAVPVSKQAIPLPEEILNKKRKKRGISTLTGVGNFQRTILDLGDADEDDVSTSKRLRTSHADASATSSASNAANADSEFTKLYTQLDGLSPCPALFSQFTFSKLLEIKFDTTLLENLVTRSGGVWLPDVEMLQSDHSKPFKCLIADKCQRKLNYVNAIGGNIPIVSLSWVINCLKTRSVVSFKEHLIPSTCIYGNRHDQPFETSLTKKKKPLDGMLVAVTAESADFFSKISVCLDHLGAKVKGIDFQHDDRQLWQQVKKANYILVTKKGPKVERLRAVLAENIPIVTLEWLIDCGLFNKRFPWDEHGSYFHNK